jgi:hypothetical protein
MNGSEAPGGPHGELADGEPTSDSDAQPAGGHNGTA